MYFSLVEKPGIHEIVIFKLHLTTMFMKMDIDKSPKQKDLNQCICTYGLNLVILAKLVTIFHMDKLRAETHTHRQNPIKPTD